MTTTRRVAKKGPDKIATEIWGELRGILRLMEDLRAPLHHFEPLVPPPMDRPGYYVMFDQRPRRLMNGKRLGGIGKLSLPDERISSQALELAKAVWHLKDRLHQFAKATGVHIDVEAHATESPELLICADLANWKKHGANKNRSTLSPRLGTVAFDTSGSGPVEFFYDGATKQKELLVTNPTPISFTVAISVDGDVEIGDAVEVICRGFRHWLPLIETLGVLAGDDREAERLRAELCRF